MSHGGQSEFAGFYPFEGHQLVSDILELVSRSLHEQDFHPMIIFQLDVKRADHFVDEAALEFGESLQQISFRFVVHDGDGSGHDSVTFIFLMFQGGVGDHDGDSFRAAFEPAFGNQLIQFAKDRIRKRDADSLHFAFGISVLKYWLGFHEWLEIDCNWRLFCG